MKVASSKGCVTALAEELARKGVAGDVADGVAGDVANGVAGDVADGFSCVIIYL